MLIYTHGYTLTYLISSHSSKFQDLANGLEEEFRDHIYQPVLSAGDVLFFSEATIHGSLPWRAERQRRLALYRFAPANFAYGRAYLNGFGDGVLDKCTEQQRAVLCPPHAVRLERPVISQAGEVSIYLRSKEKKDHDVVVFGSEYF